MKDLLYAVLALVSAVVAAFSFMSYKGNGNTIMVVVAIVFVLLTLGFGAMFLSGRVNRNEDIHITE